MKSETLKIDDTHRNIHFSLCGHVFKEGKSHIVYVPSLEVSGYGDNPTEAMNLVKASLSSWAESLFELPEPKRFEYLEKLGWKRNPVFRKKLSNLSPTTFEDIKKQFHLPDDTLIEKIPIAG